MSSLLARAAAPCPAFTALLAALEGLAPLSLAGSWDNVGVLIAHSRPPPLASRYNVLLTNDITPAVLEHALTAFDGRPPALIVTYHPTPFSGLKRFAHDSHAARVVLTCARESIAVFSPHTSWDAAPGMLNDWLIDGVATAAGGALATSAPVKRAGGAAGEAGAGDGRVGTLRAPTTLASIIAGVKAHLQLPSVAVSLPAAHAAAGADGASAVSCVAQTLPVSTLAVCAGSGHSVLSGFTGADVWVTGEMSHHELLAAASSGVSVILTHHSKCERGFLPIVARRLEAALGGGSLEYEFLVSPVDADPLTVL